MSNLTDTRALIQRLRNLTLWFTAEDLETCRQAADALEARVDPAPPDEKLRAAFNAGDGAFITHNGRWIFTEYAHDSQARAEAFAAYLSPAPPEKEVMPSDSEKNEEKR